MIIQFCGLSGSGKSTIAQLVKTNLEHKHIPVEIIDGDEYRKVLCSDLGFSKEDRNTNIRRLAFVASKLSSHNIVTIICAINPYDDIRNEVRATYPDVKTVFIDCSLDVLVSRDTKGLYKKSMLPNDHPEKIHNLTGVNDPFDRPTQIDLLIKSDSETPEQSANKLVDYILAHHKNP